MVAHGSTITASNTGYTAYFSPSLGRNLVLGDLTVIAGSPYISDYFPEGTEASPTVVEGYHFTGQVKMDVSWITWKGCLFDFAVTLRPAGVDQVGGYFEYCSFLPATPGEWPIGHQGYSAHRCRMEGHADGPRVNGGPNPQYITECFIRLAMQDYLDHNDGGQNQDGAGDVYFLGCNIDTHVVQLYEPGTGAIKGGPGVCVLSGDMATPRHWHMEVSDCFLNGIAGDFTLGFRCGDIDPDITYKAARNQFVRGNGPVVYVDTPVNQITWFDNTYSDNGEAIPLAGSIGNTDGEGSATRSRTRGATATAKRTGASTAVSSRTRTATGVAARLGSGTATSSRTRTRTATATRTNTSAGTAARVRTRTATATRTNTSAGTAARVRTRTATATRTGAGAGGGARSRSGTVTAIQVDAGVAVAVASRVRDASAAAAIASPTAGAATRVHSGAAVAARANAGAATATRTRARTATAARAGAATAATVRTRTRTATAARKQTAVTTSARLRSGTVVATTEYTVIGIASRMRSSYAQAESPYMGAFSTRSYIVVARPGFAVTTSRRTWTEVGNAR